VNALRLLEAIRECLFRLDHSFGRPRRFWEISTLMTEREANAGPITSFRCQVRTMFDRRIGRGVLARPALLRESQQGVDFAGANIGGRLVALMLLLSGIRLHTDGGGSRNVIDGIKDARGR
jgi:hypothetical protein